jgi:hypothetical protein
MRYNEYPQRHLATADERPRLEADQARFGGKAINHDTAITYLQIIECRYFFCVVLVVCKRDPTIFRLLQVRA